MDAIREPWYEFLVEQNEIKNDDIANDTRSMEEVLRWASSSISVGEGENQKKLGDIVDIEGFIFDMWDESMQHMVQSDLTQFQIPVEDPNAPVIALRKPNKMFMDGCIEPVDGVMSWCMSDPTIQWAGYDGRNCWEDKGGDQTCRIDIDCGPPCEKSVQQQQQEDLRNGLARYGLTEEGITQWFTGVSQAYEEMERRHEREEIEQAQSAVASAKDGALRFLDGVIEDARKA